MSSELRTISEQELKDILDKHGKWLRNEEGGERADLSLANLSFADLSYADLSFADLSYADLSYADLSSANLSSANLSSANLSLADLRYTNLWTFQAQRQPAYYTFDGTLRIGCLVMPITESFLGYEEIGKKEGYTEEQVQAYGSFIKMCYEHFKRKTHEP